MAKSANIQIRINAIAKDLSNGTGRDKIISKYCKKFQLTPRQIDNYIKKAQQQAQEAQDLKNKAEADALYEHAKESEKRRLLTRDEKRELLYKIANGEMEVEKVVFTKMGPQLISCKPDHQDIMKAIEIDSKMEGHFAPTKVAPTDKDGNDLPLEKLPIIFK